MNLNLYLRDTLSSLIKLTLIYFIAILLVLVDSSNQIYPHSISLPISEWYFESLINSLIYQNFIYWICLKFSQFDFSKKESNSLIEQNMNYSYPTETLDVRSQSFQNFQKFPKIQRNISIDLFNLKRFYHLIIQICLKKIFLSLSKSRISLSKYIQNQISNNQIKKR